MTSGLFPFGVATRKITRSRDTAITPGSQGERRRFVAQDADPKEPLAEMTVELGFYAEYGAEEFYLYDPETNDPSQVRTNATRQKDDFSGRDTRPSSQELRR